MTFRERLAWLAFGKEPEPPAVEASSAEGGGYLVPAGTTWSQILDYSNGTGELWPLELYGVGTVGGSRNGALHYATLFRCISLLTGITAQVVCNGRLRVVDRQGMEVKTPRARRAVELLTESPDGRLPAHTWVEDFMADYLLDGNALAALSRRRGLPRSLIRMSSYDSETVVTTSGDLVYRVREAEHPGGTSRLVASPDIAHIRWPRLQRATSAGALYRRDFAFPPVLALRPALRVGMQADQFIREWFADGTGTGAQLGISVPGRITEETRTQFAEAVKARMRRREPILLGHGAQFVPLKQSAQSEDMAGLREYQVREVGRVYGVPTPVLGENLTGWGSGIEALVRTLWKFGGKLHTDRFLYGLRARLLAPGTHFMPDTSELLRGDSKGMAEITRILQGDAQREPLATREELRRMNDLPREPDGEFPASLTPEPEPSNVPDDAASENDDEAATDE